MLRTERSADLRHGLIDLRASRICFITSPPREGLPEGRAKSGEATRRTVAESVITPSVARRGDRRQPRAVPECRRRAARASAGTAHAAASGAGWPCRDPFAQEHFVDVLIE